MIRVALVGSSVLAVIIGFYAIQTPKAPAAQVDVSLTNLVVYPAQPSRVIKHGVNWRTILDSNKRDTLLTGPVMYSASVPRDENATERILFSWYRMPNPEQPSVYTVQVRPAKRNDTSIRINLGSAVFFLSATQQLGDGKPAEFPKALSHFVAYPIAKSENQPGVIELNADGSPGDLSAGGPAFLCIPAEEWHHDEHFPITHPSLCWIVYETSPREHTEKISTLDQFGLNTLELDSAKWLCVPGAEFELVVDAP